MVRAGRDGGSLVEEVTDHVEAHLVGAEVLGSAPTGGDEPVVGRGVDVVEGGVQREVVPAFLDGRLVATDVVDGRLRRVTLALPGQTAYLVAHHPERLERHRGLEVFAEVTDDHQASLALMESRAERRGGLYPVGEETPARFGEHVY